jgi:hypothetical protein
VDSSVKWAVFWLAEEEDVFVVSPFVGEWVEKELAATEADGEVFAEVVAGADLGAGEAGG